MDAKTSLKNRLPSRHVTEGPARAPHRSYYYAMGLTKEQIHQPFVGVASCWNEAAPCNIALMRQAQAVKKGVAANGGSEQLPGALPLICNPGDVTIVNRQTLHGSFANTTPDMRVSITFGFHRRKSVLGQKTALSMATQGATYDEARIARRASVIATAIDARRQYYPDERPFCYQPFVGCEREVVYDAATFANRIRDYNVDDLAI